MAEKLREGHFPPVLHTQQVNFEFSALRGAKIKKIAEKLGEVTVEDACP